MIRDLGSSTKNFCEFVASSANDSLSRSKSSSEPKDKILRLLANKEFLSDHSQIDKLIGLRKNSKNPQEKDAIMQELDSMLLEIQMNDMNFEKNL